MNLLSEALAWIFGPDSDVAQRLGEHLSYTLLAFVLACVIAIPLGYLIGHTGKGREVAVTIAGAARALPSFGLILLLVLLIGVLQIVPAVTLALVLLAIPSILAGAYAGLEAIDRSTVDAARAIGMTEWQILTKVEIPLGLQLLISGMRAGILQIVATATLAAYVGLGGLGFPVIQGIAVRRFDETLGGALLVVLLALLLDTVFAVLERLAVPRGVRLGRGRGDRRRRPSRRTAEQNADAAARLARAGAPT
ncbi:ABC transporter permease [Naasia aerilata]|uniref:Osmoprotectant (Glycine betaine/ carnitine/choline/l-proline) ABC transporter ProZ n=1 Tax=Naasia aerilata TaxID=1162966 RepID=A0ABN6XSG9_9MICO|nr:ABC transporter permease subunit [Naasia aerilata]BDZ46606.1 putative osmoprotectant (glycine betaine/ carnitine/choline/l-proline) ABC transporter ProZ [Naasia aerilata]